MSLIKPAVLTAAFLLGMLVCDLAWADQAADDYAKLPVCTLSADGSKLAVEPCRTAPAQKPMPRRPVPQIIERMPQAQRAPLPARSALPPSSPLQSLTTPARAPVPTTSCDAAGCFGANGVRYDNVGKGVMTPSGKVCTRAGGVVQC